MKFTVTFMMWGQECETTFDSQTSELVPDLWARTIEEKGWAIIIEIVREDGLVIYREDSDFGRIADLVWR